MKKFIFRNMTVEHLFSKGSVQLSEYNSILFNPLDADLFIWFYIVPLNQNRRLLKKEIESYYKNILFIYEQIPHDKQFVVFTLVDILNSKVVIGDFDIEATISKFNLEIFDLSKQYNNIKVFDFLSFVKQYNVAIDWKYYFLALMPISQTYTAKFESWFSKHLKALSFDRKKCLIIDLDNTIWGGVLGEDGINGIVIGGTYPGNAYYEFQKNIIYLVNNGIILAICSKNNERDVFELWEKNEEILIKKKHISAHRINWGNKAKNIQSIVQELNIGEDSVVFIDDNPAERELVKKYLPNVIVPDFPEQPYGLQGFIAGLIDEYFLIYGLTIEDKNKTIYYKANRKKKEFENSFDDFDEYLKSLEIEIEIQSLNKSNVARISQMTQKTNQFNLTTNRYSVADINTLSMSGCKIFCISVKDKFGDNGITGLTIYRIENSIAHIDTFLLSCRILGKCIEKTFLKATLAKIKELGVVKVQSSFKPSLKNKQVECFFEDNGFTLLCETNNEKRYEVLLDKYNFDAELYHKVQK